MVRIAESTFLCQLNGPLFDRLERLAQFLRDYQGRCTRTGLELGEVLGLQGKLRAIVINGHDLGLKFGGSLAGRLLGLAKYAGHLLKNEVTLIKSRLPQHLPFRAHHPQTV